MQTVLYIDGQNFLNKLQDVLFREKKIRHFEYQKFDFTKLINTAISDLRIDRKLFYAARIRQHPDTATKSQELINKQRFLKTRLEKDGFEFIIAGNVRGNYETDLRTGKQTLVFKEKGVDVRMAVDTIAMACDKEVATAIICSSDSDLQPAITQLKQRNVSVIYLGFEFSPNKGLLHTTDRGVLFRNAEIVGCYSQHK